MQQKASSSCVQVGSVVTVKEVGLDDVQKFKIVLPHETKAGGGRISSSSPFGRAILNSSPGATISVAAPIGEILFKVLDIA